MSFDQRQYRDFVMNLHFAMNLQFVGALKGQDD